MGMHFFSPAHMMPLVECIRGEVSSSTTIAVVMGITKRLKKVPTKKRKQLACSFTTIRNDCRKKKIAAVCEIEDCVKTHFRKLRMTLSIARTTVFILLYHYYYSYPGM